MLSFEHSKLNLSGHSDPPSADPESFLTHGEHKAEGDALPDAKEEPGFRGCRPQMVRSVARVHSSTLIATVNVSWSSWSH